MCGGSFFLIVPKIAGMGTSPRVWGKPSGTNSRLCRRRYIPACAGEAPRARWRSGAKRVHPRVCGGSATRHPASPGGSGTSPRVRGKRRDALRFQLGVRYIPACAGEASVRRLDIVGLEVHPRVCGGSRRAAGDMVVAEGTSPRVRGKRTAGSVRVWSSRYIPACAGEAIAPIRTVLTVRVHPRVCGGSPLPRASVYVLAGTSPRVRGKRYLGRIPCLSVRYIPACAGEARRSGATRAAKWVHPRVCGGSPRV